VLADFDSAVQMRSVGETSRANTPPHVHSAAGGGLTNVAALLGSGAALQSAHSTSSFPSSSDVFVDSVEPGDGVWCAPELLQSTLSASPACDIFSLGASVYAVLMDHIPEKDPATGEVQLDFGASAAPTGAVVPSDQQQAPHQLRGHCVVSVELQQLLLAMTSSHPSSRPSAAQVLSQADAWIAWHAARQEQAQQPPSSSLAAVDCRQIRSDMDAAEPMHTDTTAAASMA
jgi:serine/threonine protein kinase